MTVPDGMSAKGTTFVSVSTPTGMEADWFESGVAESMVRDVEKLYGSVPSPRVEPTAEDERRCGGLGEGYVSMGVEPDGWIPDPALESQEVVIGWLLKRSGGYPSEPSQRQCANTGDLVRRFANLDSRRREAWLDENFADLRAGKVALKDLP